MARAEKRARSAHSEKIFWSTSRAISVTRPNPWAPRTTRGRSPTMLSTLPPRWSASSSLVTRVGGVPTGVMGFTEPANVSIASSDGTCCWPAGNAGKDLAQHAVADRLPVAAHSHHEVPAMPDPIDQRLGGGLLISWRTARSLVSTTMACAASKPYHRPGSGLAWGSIRFTISSAAPGVCPWLAAAKPGRFGSWSIPIGCPMEKTTISSGRTTSGIAGMNFSWGSSNSRRPLPSRSAILNSESWPPGRP